MWLLAYARLYCRPVVSAHSFVFPKTFRCMYYHHPHLNVRSETQSTQGTWQDDAISGGWAVWFEKPSFYPLSDDLNLIHRSVGQAFWVGWDGNTHWLGKHLPIWLWRVVINGVGYIEPSTSCLRVPQLMAVSLSLFYVTVSDRWRLLLAFRSPSSGFHNPPWLRPAVFHSSQSQSVLPCGLAQICLWHAEPLLIHLPAVKVRNWWWPLPLNSTI